MAPEYAGLLNALANTLGNYCGFVTAAMAGFLFDSLEDDEKAWNYIFIINGAIALTCGTYIREHPVDAGASSRFTYMRVIRIIYLGIIFILFVQTTRFKWTLKTKDSLILDNKKDDLM